MAGRPYLLENLSDETSHGAALVTLLADPGTAGYSVAVATGYVNLAGLHHLARSVNDGRGVRLLLGAEPDPALGAQFPVGRFEQTLRTLAEQRDLARFPPSRAAAQLADIATWLEDGSVEVRRYIETFLHGKAYLFGTLDDARAALVTSANLTGAGLFRNLELGLVHYDTPVAEIALQWFQNLWERAPDFEDALRDLLFPDPGLVDPETVYLRALLERYGDELDHRDAGPPPTVPLAAFQTHGFERAREIVSRHRGVVYADGVGTGKTEIGLAFIEEYAQRRGQHALVVAPAQLASLWRERISHARLPAQVVTFQQLASDEQLAPQAANRRRHLHNARDTYRLIVIDEGHAFRNPDTTWYRALDRLLGGHPKDLVLLTATPINNGLWDLFHLVMLFARHDRAFVGHGIPSLRDLFVEAGANSRDPENLDPDVLFPIADAVSVRRDRRFIEEHYPGATFPDGTPVRFPEPLLETRRYDLDAAHPGIFAAITGLIDDLTMARYRPSAYEMGGEETIAEATLGGLLRSGLLKRFESCWVACRNSAARRVAAHRGFLAAWDAGVVPSRQALRDAANEEIDEAGLATWVADALLEDDARPTTAFDPRFRDDVASDLELLEQIQELLDTLDADSDPKLALLRQVLEESPANKIAVFATYTDTIRYLDEHLPTAVNGRDRVVVIGNETNPDERTEALARFSPQTVVRPDYVPADGEVDLLLSTDVVSEGQNLQQAAAVVSYDMPWNPQRVVQRNGRVIRLKSPHDTVFLTTMLPEPGDLEELLRLEARIRAKILAAGGVFGMESEVIEGVTTELRNYAARLATGDASLLNDDDASADSPTGFSGEELRAQLFRAFAEGEVARLRRLPWGIGAAFRQGPNVPSVGGSGTFFACRTASGYRYWRFVEPDGSVIAEEAEILRRIEPGTAPGVDIATSEVDIESAWNAAVADIVAVHNLRAAAADTSGSIGPVQRFALEVLRDPAVPLPSGAANAEAALSVERSSAVRQALGVVRGEVVSATISREEAARRVVEVVQTYGLREVEPSPTVDPITADEVGVVCWMAVLPPV